VTSDENHQADQRAPRRQPIFLLPGVVTALAGLMVAVHIAASVLSPEGQRELILWFGFVPLRFIAGMEHPEDLLPLLWTPVTHAFLHADWEHLIINVAWLAIFATPIARRYGSVTTTGLFLLSAVAGAAAFTLTTLLFGARNGVFLVGASGGVAGLTGAATRFIFQPVLYARDPDTGELVPIGRRLASLRETFANPRSRYFALIWVILNAAVPLLPMLAPVDMAIAWQAHLGGFCCGLLLVPLFERRS